jgi:hypothetical protein
MVDYKNVRVAVVTREGDKDWAGTGRYLSIRAYRGRAQFGNAVFMGPDIPIESGLSSEEVERVAHAMLTALCGSNAEWREEHDVRVA